MSYSQWADFVYYRLGDIAMYGSITYQALQPNINVVPTGLAPDWQVLPAPAGAGVSSLETLTGAITLSCSSGTYTTAGNDIALAINFPVPPPLQGFFIDTALPAQVIDGTTLYAGFDITPPFYQPDKHYQITYTTLFTSLIGAPLTGSIKFGVSQNAVPFALPLNNQESSQVFDVAFAFTASNAFSIIYSVSVSYLSEVAFPPNLTLWFEGTGLSDKVSIAPREASVLLLD